MTFDTPTGRCSMVRYDRMQSNERVDIDEATPGSLAFARTKSLTMASSRSKKDVAATSLRRVKGAYTEDDMVALISTHDEEAATVMKAETDSRFPAPPSRSNPFNTIIAELKKLNNIQNDAEVQARQSIKIPIAKYGIFSEQVENLRPPPRRSKDEVAPAEELSVDGKLAKMMNNIESAVKEGKEKLSEKEDQLGPAESITFVPVVITAKDKSIFDSGRTLYYLLLVALLVACIPFLLFMPGMNITSWLRD